MLAATTDFVFGFIKALAAKSASIFVRKGGENQLFIPEIKYPFRHIDHRPDMQSITHFGKPVCQSQSWAVSVAVCMVSQK